MSCSLVSDLNSLRVDLVGSLLRPRNLKTAFAKFAAGEATEAELKITQDDAIREVVVKQLERGLPVVVDGEFRRTSFMESFAVVAGVEEWQTGVKTYHQILAREDTSESVSHKGQDPILLNRKPVTQRLQAGAQFSARRLSLCPELDRSSRQGDFDQRRSNLSMLR